MLLGMMVVHSTHIVEANLHLTVAAYSIITLIMNNITVKLNKT